MSIEAITWALNNSEATGTTRCILIALANGARPETAECFPSHKHLAKQARCCVSSVKRAIADLEKAGELLTSSRRSENGRVTSNTYLLPHVGCSEPEARLGEYDLEVWRRKHTGVQIDPQSNLTPSSPLTRAQSNGDLYPQSNGDLVHRETKEGTQRETLSAVPAKGAREKVPGGQPVPGEPARAEPKPKPEARYTPQSNALARELWGTLDPKPLVGFMALRARVSEALGAGYTEQALRLVAPHVASWSRNELAFAFRKHSIDPKAGAPAASYYTDPADYGL